MEVNKSKGSHAVKGGQTILGNIFAYQERTGMSIDNIMQLPYIMFVISMLDAPQIDYESTSNDNTPTETDTVDAQINAVANALN